MCGVAAIFAYGTDAPPVDKERLQRMHDALAPRGPDGEGVWMAEDGRLGMAHRRLSIIDLSDAAAQPMATQDGALRVAIRSWLGYVYRRIAK